MWQVLSREMHVLPTLPTVRMLQQYWAGGWRREMRSVHAWGSATVISACAGGLRRDRGHFLVPHIEESLLGFWQTRAVAVATEPGLQTLLDAERRLDVIHLLVASIVGDTPGSRVNRLTQ
jgi:hypothetical protein